MSQVDAKFRELQDEATALRQEGEAIVQRLALIQMRLGQIDHTAATLRELEPMAGLVAPAGDAPAPSDVNPEALLASEPMPVVFDLEGNRVEPGPDGLIHSLPALELSDEQRAAMPTLLPHDAEAPFVFGSVVQIQEETAHDEAGADGTPPQAEQGPEDCPLPGAGTEPQAVQPLAETPAPVGDGVGSLEQAAVNVAPIKDLAPDGGNALSGGSLGDAAADAAPALPGVGPEATAVTPDPHMENGCGWVAPLEPTQDPVSEPTASPEQAKS